MRFEFDWGPELVEDAWAIGDPPQARCRERQERYIETQIYCCYVELGRAGRSFGSPADRPRVRQYEEG